MSDPTPVVSAEHVKLEHALRMSPGWSPELRSGLAVLDPAIAGQLAYVIEQMRIAASRSAAGGWVRGCWAGQQL